MPPDEMKGMTKCDKNPASLRTWNRIPPWIKGAGAALGVLSNTMTGRGCG